MTSIATVLAWDVDALDRAADALAADRSRLVGLQDELDDGAPPGTWSGPASGAARAAHGRLVNRLTGTVAEVSAVAAAVDAAAASLREATADLRSMLDWAQRNGYAVDRASGRVDDQGCHPDDVAADRALVATEVAERLRQALLTATHADAQLAGVLDRVASGALDAGGGSLDEAAAAGAADGALGVRPAPLDGSPAEANAWWESLTDDEQQQVLAEHPEWLGSTDGIPAGVRDQANRALIGVYRAELEAEEARLRAALDGNLLGGLFTSDDAALEVVREKLAGLDRVEQVLKRGSRQLLVLDITGSRQLMAAVAVGDVDTADHVAVFTPGFTTTVAGSLTSYDSSMAELRAVARAEARKYGDGGTVATVSWLGYEAPQWDEWHDLGGRFVTSDSSAQAGAASLADFYRGIDASRAQDPHLTALGHSYGSTTTGIALQQQTGVDAAVVFGSPGLGTSHVGDLDVPGGQVFRIEARRDVVADLGHFGVDPSHVDGITGLSAREAVLDGTTYRESTGHSQYLSQDTTSQHNIAAVVAGAPDRMVLDAGRGAGDLLSWPVPGTY
ncbi:alpha/beta hydrolase family protein [Cellulomonas hominis]|uniref:alpha/beta hydrolase n=1 Tax=Cellulomonas hominis TaxID=156981 RepID=UPI001C102958|nr:alpha/beta hydrolase [Cellulomonas hominis]MBU5423097.1 alpha/beta hydrolase family protein [Cellulomonas hominis]